jgi:hypothetical protein
MTDAYQGRPRNIRGYGDGSCDEFGEGFADSLGDYIHYRKGGGGHGYGSGAGGPNYGYGEGTAGGYSSSVGSDTIEGADCMISAYFGEEVFVVKRAIFVEPFRNQREYFFTREEAETALAVKLLRGEE